MGLEGNKKSKRKHEIDEDFGDFDLDLGYDI